MISTTNKIVKSILQAIPGELGNKIVSLAYDAKQFAQSYLLSSKISNVESFNTNKISIIGTFKSSVSHSFAALLLEKELLKHNYEIAKIDISELVNAPLDNSATHEKNNYLKTDTIILVINPDNIINVIQDLGTNILTNKRVIGYWVWEHDKPPKKWKKCNKLVHEIWTPSKYSADSLSKIFDKPIHIVPHPCALIEKPIPDIDTKKRLRKIWEIEEDDFCIIQSLSLSSSLARKNAIGSINAFLSAFPNNEKAKLIIRYFAGDNFLDAEKRLIKAASKDTKKIKLIKSSGKISELERLYAIADVYISLHRAEGFGLNLAEAMLAGIPVIATSQTGNLEFMDKECAILIDALPVKVKDPDNIYNQKNATWFEPDLVSAKNALIKLYNDRQLCINIGAKGREKAIKTLSGGAANIALKTK